MKKQEFDPYERNYEVLQEGAVKMDRKKSSKGRQKKYIEEVIHMVFLLLGLITVGCVLLITVYLVISGIPAIREIGVVDFLFGTKWASTAKEPEYGILPFILTSIYGTAGAIVIGVPVGFMTAVYLSKLASPKVKGIMQMVYRDLLYLLLILQSR